MITAKQWKIYKDNFGDDGIFYRSAWKKDIKLMEGFAWSFIDELIQELYMLNTAKLGDEYGRRVLDKLDKLVCEPGVKEDIVKYSGQLMEIQEKYKRLLNKWG